MKKIIAALWLAAAALFGQSCNVPVAAPAAETPSRAAARRSVYPLKDSLDAIVGKYLAKGIPGVQVAVRNDAGWYYTSGSNGAPLPEDLVTWYFSITKIYTAALVMKLKESGRIDLDAPIGAYLPAEVAAGIPQRDQITVRMLLSHTSGIVNVTALPAFVQWQFEKPLQQPSVTERMEMVYGKPLLFAPGTDFSYSNTNYLLLHYVIESAAGVPYGKLLHQEILQPLKLGHTYYALPAGPLRNFAFPDYYFDPNASGQLVNGTEWNKALGNSCISYGGIAGTAGDAILFLEALVNGRVVSAASLNEMKTWVQGKASTAPDYGLGLEYYQYGSGPHQYGHEGDGIGCTTQVLYVPANQTYLFINVTVGRQLPGPYLFKATDLKNELCRYVANWRVQP